MRVDKGRCYVETSLVQGARFAHASLGQIKTAAEAVMRKCTVGGQLQGGIASNIGKQYTKHHRKIFRMYDSLICIRRRQQTCRRGGRLQ